MESYSKNIMKNFIGLRLFFLYLFFSSISGIISITLNSENESGNLLEELNDVNFDFYISNSDCYIIHFYDSDCEVCHNLNNILEEASFLVYSEGIKCKFFKFNFSKNSIIKNKNEWEIKEFPSLFLILKEINLKLLFDGIRDSEEIVKFVKNNIGEFKFKKIQNISQLNDYNEKIKGNFLIIFGDQVKYKERVNKIKNILFPEIYDQDRSFRDGRNKQSEKSMLKLGNYYDIILYTDNEEIKEAFLNSLKDKIIYKNFPNDFFIGIRNFDRIKKEPIEYEVIKLDEIEWLIIDNSENEDYLLKIFSLFKYKFCDNMTEEKVDHIFETLDSSFIIFVEKKEDIDNIIENNQFKEIYDKFRKNYHFSYSTLDEKSTFVIKDILRLTKEQLPLFLFTKKSKIKPDEFDKFVNVNNKLTLENVVKFIENVEGGRIDKFLTSEDLPEFKQEMLKYPLKIVGSNFENFIMQNKNILLVFCTKLSKNCNKFKTILNRLSFIFSNFIPDNFIIGETDPNFNDYKVDLDQNIYPTVYFFKREIHKFDKDNFQNLYNRTFLFDNSIPIYDLEKKFKSKISYSGKLMTNNLKEFIIENLENFNSIEIKKFENQTAIDLQEAEDMVLPLKFINYNSNEDDFDYQSLIDNKGIDKNNIAGVFKSFGGEIDQNGEFKINDGGKTRSKLEELKLLKEMFEGVNNNDLLNERLNQLQNFNILGNVEKLSTEQKIEKINELLEEYYLNEIIEEDDFEEEDDYLDDESEDGEDESNAEEDSKDKNSDDVIFDEL